MVNPTLVFDKLDLAKVEADARKEAEDLGLDEDTTEILVKKALDHARSLNAMGEKAEDHVRQLKVAGSSSSSSSPGEIIPDRTSSGLVNKVKENVRVSIQMPERYNGDTDFAAWLRRYENTANAAGWDSLTKALRLGMYLSDDFYESWDQYATKEDFEQDCRTLTHVFARCTTDASLEKFHALKWSGDTNLSVFLARARRLLLEYNRKLPAERQLPTATIEQMVLDKLISVAPPAAKAELRKTKPSSIEEMIDIVSDYTDTGTTNSTAVPASTLQRLEDRLDNKLSKVMAAVTSTPQGLSTPPDLLARLAQKIESLERNLSSRSSPNRQQGNGPRRPAKCGICTGAHFTRACPLKQFDSGCYLCGGDHLARACPKSLVRGQKTAQESQTGSSGN